MYKFLDIIIHNYIGITGQIDPEESLFTYPGGLSALNYSFPDHVPLFLDEVFATASQEILDLCQGNIRCIYDAVQTGNLDIGRDTMTIEETNTDDRMIASKSLLVAILFCYLFGGCCLMLLCVLDEFVVVVAVVFVVAS